MFSRCKDSARRAKPKAKNTFFDLDFRAAAYLREAKRARQVKSKAKNTFFDLDFRAAAYLREAKQCKASELTSSMRHPIK